eukprot:221989_1
MWRTDQILAINSIRVIQYSMTLIHLVLACDGDHALNQCGLAVCCIGINHLMNPTGVCAQIHLISMRRYVDDVCGGSGCDKFGSDPDFDNYGTMRSRNIALMISSFLFLISISILFCFSIFPYLVYFSFNGSERNYSIKFI